jgi:methylated-DNA-[protein]-cysteine S-methyltransferase
MHRLLRVHYGRYALSQGGDTRRVRAALDAYFDGDLAVLDSIPTATGGTPFQRAVWNALRGIEPSTTRSYGQIAKNLGRTNSSRAVGAANGANPIAIVVPCHRVVGANGTLTGYAGGLERKRWLLDHERQSLHSAANGGRNSGEQKIKRPPAALPAVSHAFKH